MTNFDRKYAQSMIKDYCDELVQDNEELEEKLKNAQEEIEKLKEILSENNIDY